MPDSVNFKIVFPVNIDSKEDSNLFLRALWARFRSEFGSCAWQFMPMNFREIGLTSFGHMSISTENTIEVSVTYKKRGTIKNIEFADRNKKELPLEMAKVIKETLSVYKTEIKRFVLYKIVKFMYPMVYYEMPFIEIVPLENRNNRVKMVIMAYDKKDAEFVYKKKMNSITDVLITCLWTDIVDRYLQDDRKIEDSNELRSASNIFIENVETDVNDEVGVFKGQYYLPEKALVLMNKIVAENNLSRQINKFLAASRLYKNGLKLEDLSRMAINQGIDYTEMVMVAYMSSLEVLAADDAIKSENCDACGQKKYSIARRVKDLAAKASDENPYFIKIVNSFYQNRSKFLHEGVFSSADSYIGGSIPQISESEDGVEHQVYYLSDLRFRAGQVFHWAIQNSIII